MQGNNEIKSICFVVGYYPTPGNERDVFVKTLIEAIADKGIDCTVIAPRPYYGSDDKITPYKTIQKTAAGKTVTVYRPYHMMFSSKSFLVRFSSKSYCRAVYRCVQENNINPDAFYGHFIGYCGIAAAYAAVKCRKKSFIAVGENSSRLQKGSLTYSNGMKYAGWKQLLDTVTGFVCVSAENRRLLIENGFLDKSKADRAQVFVNGINSETFHPMDRSLVRKELGYSEEDFIVSCVGQFCNRKGTLRVCRAIEKLPGVKSIFIGNGSNVPDCEGILFSGAVPHDKICKYLCASDVFVLPTLAEGCCNAILEALACGIPVISSDLPFNDEILTEKNSIRVDPENISEIADAIRFFQENPEQKDRMGREAYRMASLNTIQKRAERILHFMEGEGNE